MIGMLLAFSSVKTEQNCSLKMLAFPLLSKINLDPFFNLLDLSSGFWNNYCFEKTSICGAVSLELAFVGFPVLVNV